jgi:tetratricopeptide (TPR) repeat protein
MVTLSGCLPPGPRALLKGEKLLGQGRYPEAVVVLEQATTLLPRNAQAWNHLGLAHHGAGDAAKAQAAYVRALSLDNNLAVVRYNLGCLYLERTNLPPAIQELTAYALLQPNSVEARLRLGTALLRARRLDEAERRFREVLELHPRHPQALNNLGIIQVQKRNPREAANYFNLVLTHDPAYAPALLNLAVLNQAAFNNRPAALQGYRKYLAAQPGAADSAAVQAVLSQLDAELNPAARPPRAPAPAAPPPTPTVRTTAVAAASPPRPAPATNRSPATVASVPRPAPAPVAKPAPTPPPPSPVAITTPPPPAPVPSAPPIPVTEVAREELVVAPARDVSPAAVPAAPERPSSSPTAVPAAPAGDAAREDARRGLLTRLNPFGGKGRPASPGPVTNAPARPGQTVSAPPKPAPPPPPPPPRYPLQTPAPVKPGNRAAAEPAFARGVTAQQGREFTKAIAEYQYALAQDPSYYEAYYNLAVAARDSGQLGLALAAYEGALGVKPDAADARYNFALALRAGGFTLDAADQLQQMLRARPDEVRLHLSLGNLYSQNLRENAKARNHYQRVLALQPGHPEAERIRAWLTANP